MCWSKVFWSSLDFKWLISSPLKLVKSLLLGSNLSCQVTLCWINLIKFVARVVTYMIYTWWLSYSHLVLYFLSAWNNQCDHIGFKKPQATHIQNARNTRLLSKIKSNRADPSFTVIVGCWAEVVQRFGSQKKCIQKYYCKYQAGKTGWLFFA